MSPIPQIIHQTYKTANAIPAYYRSDFQQSWKDNHPTWQYQFWTDSDLRKLAADKYPGHLAVFDNGQWPGITRADLGRLMVLDMYGGWYADMDYASLRPLDPLLANDARQFIGAPIPNRGEIFTPQALVGSVASHPILKATLSAGVEYVKKGNIDVAGSYGYVKFALMVWRHRKDADVYLPEPEVLAPLSWQAGHHAYRDSHRGLSLDELRTLYPNSLAITFWEQGWGKARPANLVTTPNILPAPSAATDALPQKMAAVAPEQKPLPLEEWPLWARQISKYALPDHSGVGDTVKYLLGEKGEWFKKMYRKWTGEDCGCRRRQAEWNTLYPYSEVRKISASKTP